MVWFHEMDENIGLFFVLSDFPLGISDDTEIKVVSLNWLQSSSANGANTLPATVSVFVCAQENL